MCEIWNQLRRDMRIAPILLTAYQERLLGHSEAMLDTAFGENRGDDLHIAMRRI